MIKKRLKIQEIDKRIEVTRGVDGKMSECWESHGKWLSENQNKRVEKLKPCTWAAKPMWKWNKKRGIREKSIKGSKDFDWW